MNYYVVFLICLGFLLLLALYSMLTDPTAISIAVFVAAVALAVVSISVYPGRRN